MSSDPKTPGEIFGRHIRDLRRAAGLSQAELADLMEQVGYATWVRQTVGEVEAGRRRIDWDELLILASIFDVSPMALVVGESSVGYEAGVKVGDRVLPAGEFASLWRARLPSQGPVRDLARKAVDRLLGGRVIRPWADTWRRRGGHPGQPYAEAREEALAARGRHPGPIYVLVGDEPVEPTTTVPPWSTPVRFRLKPGEPYVARDEWEAERLAAMEQQGMVRRISREEAYRMRRKR